MAELASWVEAGPDPAQDGLVRWRRQDLGRRIGERFGIEVHERTVGTYRSSRKLDRGLFAKLIVGDWIAAHDNLVICGPTGVGKSWLACALGHKACRDDCSVLYQRVPKLFTTLALARGDGRHARFLAKLGSVQLLILDDWGLEPLDARARHDLLEILEERYGRRSTIITSQLPVAAWHEVIGDQTYSDAILDRLVHNAHRLDLDGDSMRRTKSRPQA